MRSRYTHRVRREVRWTPKVALGLTVVGLFAVAGFISLHNSFAASISTPGKDEASMMKGSSAIANDTSVSDRNSARYGAVSDGVTANPTGLLAPYSMGFAPYAYVPYGNITMADYSSATGTKTFFAAFILGSGCVPLWDGNAALGLSSARSAAILDDIHNVRSKGGDVSISFGGASGNELANSCTNSGQLQAAYQSVIDHFGLRQVNFDLEGNNETDPSAMTRRVQSLAALQKTNPGLKVSLTLPVEPTGLDPIARGVIQKFHDGGVVVSSVDIMAMDFGASSSAESGRVISAAKATVGQLKRIYTGLSAEQAYKALGIIVLFGKNDVANEVFTTADAQAVHTFATQNNVGTLSMWSANRDLPCRGGATLANDTCSGTAQTQYQFANLLTIPRL